MRNRETIAGLLTRVKAAEGADRELDVSLAVALYDWCRHERKTHSGCQDDTGFTCDQCGADSWGNRGSSGQGLHDAAPAVTASIDAALALVERMLPGWDLDLNINGIGNSGLSFAQLRGPNLSDHDPRQYADNGSTPMPAPLAILAALLAALRDAPSTESGGEPGRDPSRDTGWSGSAPNPSVSASGDHPSRGASSDAVEPDEPFHETLPKAYGWAIDDDGYLWGLVAGDMGYDKTDTKLCDLFQAAHEAEWERYRRMGEKVWPVHAATLDFIAVLGEATAPPPRVSDQSGEAGTTEGRDPKDAGAVGAAETPNRPDPNPRSDSETAAVEMREDDR